MKAGALAALAGAALLSAGGKKAMAALRRDVPFIEIFSRMAAKYAVPKRLMIAIVRHESRFDPKAVNSEPEADARKGRDVDSIGLGQILWPDTARDYGITTRDQLFDPETNIDAVARILRDKLRRYPAEEGAFPFDAVSAYNGGHSLRKGASFWNQEYVNAVKIAWEHFADV